MSEPRSQQSLSSLRDTAQAATREYREAIWSEDPLAVPAPIEVARLKRKAMGAAQTYLTRTTDWPQGQISYDPLLERVCVPVHIGGKPPFFPGELRFGHRALKKHAEFWEDKLAPADALPALDTPGARVVEGGPGLLSKFVMAGVAVTATTPFILAGEAIASTMLEPSPFLPVGYDESVSLVDELVYVAPRTGVGEIGRLSFSDVLAVAEERRRAEVPMFAPVVDESGGGPTVPPLAPIVVDETGPSVPTPPLYIEAEEKEPEFEPEPWVPEDEVEEPEKDEGPWEEPEEPEEPEAEKEPWEEPEEPEEPEAEKEPWEEPEEPEEPEAEKEPWEEPKEPWEPEEQEPWTEPEPEPVSTLAARLRRSAPFATSPSLYEFETEPKTIYWLEEPHIAARVPTPVVGVQRVIPRELKPLEASAFLPQERLEITAPPLAITGIKPRRVLVTRSHIGTDVPEKATYIHPDSPLRMRAALAVKPSAVDPGLRGLLERAATRQTLPASELSRIARSPAMATLGRVYWQAMVQAISEPQIAQRKMPGLAKIGVPLPGMVRTKSKRMRALGPLGWAALATLPHMALVKPSILRALDVDLAEADPARFMLPGLDALVESRAHVMRGAEEIQQLVEESRQVQGAIEAEHVYQVRPTSAASARPGYIVQEFKVLGQPRLVKSLLDVDVFRVIKVTGSQAKAGPELAPAGARKIETRLLRFAPSAGAVMAQAAGGFVAPDLPAVLPVPMAAQVSPAGPAVPQMSPRVGALLRPIIEFVQAAETTPTRMLPWQKLTEPVAAQFRLAIARQEQKRQAPAGPQQLKAQQLYELGDDNVLAVLVPVASPGAPQAAPGPGGEPGAAPQATPALQQEVVAALTRAPELRARQMERPLEARLLRVWTRSGVLESEAYGPVVTRAEPPVRRRSQPMPVASVPEAAAPVQVKQVSSDPTSGFEDGVLDELMFALRRRLETEAEGRGGYG